MTVVKHKEINESVHGDKIKVNVQTQFQTNHMGSPKLMDHGDYYLLL